MACSHRRREQDQTVLSCPRWRYEQAIIVADWKLGRDETKLSCRRCEQAVTVVVRRRVRLGRSGSEARSPTIDIQTDRRILRHRRRRSQFATAAAAALQAAVSRAAAARPRFSATPRGLPPTPAPVRPIIIKPEQETDVEAPQDELQAITRHQCTEPDDQQTSSAAGLRHKITLIQNGHLRPVLLETVVLRTVSLTAIACDQSAPRLQ